MLHCALHAALIRVIRSVRCSRSTLSIFFFFSGFCARDTSRTRIGVGSATPLIVVSTHPELHRSWKATAKASLSRTLSNRVSPSSLNGETVLVEASSSLSCDGGVRSTGTNERSRPLYRVIVVSRTCSADPINLDRALSSRPPPL